jgi:hypothetical protein
MDLQEWLEQHPAQWHHRAPVVISKFVRPEPILGEEDAVLEWTLNRAPEKIFVHIGSYEAMKQRDVLYIFGRRGTGKTALLRMLQHEIRCGDSDSYGSSAIINPALISDELTTLLRNSYLRELTDRERIRFLYKCWYWLLRMAGIAGAAATMEDSPAVQSLRTFLDLQTRTQLSEPEALSQYLIQGLLRIVNKHLRTCGSQAELGSTLIAITEDLGSAELASAEALMTGAFRKAKMNGLVMVDTEEVYKVHDPVASAVSTALIDAVLTMYAESDTKRLFAKAAFPSEIYPHLRPTNREKTEGKSLFIIWSYRDLVTLVAKRYRRAVGEESTNVPDTLDAFAPAREYVYKFLPDMLRSRNGLEFDTLAYVIRHTQKKPRQVIELMNTVLTLAKTEQLPGLVLTGKPDYIKDGVHTRLDMLVDGTLDIYEDIYPDATRLIKRALTNARSYFPSKSLGKLLREISDLRNAHDLAIDEVKRLLVETGALGIGTEAHQLRDGHWLLEAEFEYQVKGGLMIPPDALCVIHPMFFEELKIQVDTTTFIYPLPYENEEIEVVERIGVRLGTRRPWRRG